MKKIMFIAVLCGLLLSTSIVSQTYSELQEQEVTVKWGIDELLISLSAVIVAEDELDSGEYCYLANLPGYFDIDIIMSKVTREFNEYNDVIILGAWKWKAEEGFYYVLYGYKEFYITILFYPESNQILVGHPTSHTVYYK